MSRSTAGPTVRGSFMFRQFRVNIQGQMSHGL